MARTPAPRPKTLNNLSVEPVSDFTATVSGKRVVGDRDWWAQDLVRFNTVHGRDDSTELRLPTVGYLALSAKSLGLSERVVEEVGIEPSLRPHGAMRPTVGGRPKMLEQA